MGFVLGSWGKEKYFAVDGFSEGVTVVGCGGSGLFWSPEIELSLED